MRAHTRVVMCVRACMCARVRAIPFLTSHFGSFRVECRRQVIVLRVRKGFTHFLRRVMVQQPRFVDELTFRPQFPSESLVLYVRQHLLGWRFEAARWVTGKRWTVTRQGPVVGHGIVKRLFRGGEGDIVGGGGGRSLGLNLHHIGHAGAGDGGVLVVVVHGEEKGVARRGGSRGGGVAVKRMSPRSRHYPIFGGRK